MSEQKAPITSYFSENAFAMARLAGASVEYNTDQLELFRDMASDMVGRSIPEIGALAMVYRYAPRGGDIPCDPSYNRSRPADALWIPENQLTAPTEQEVAKVSRANVEQGGRKGFEVNLKSFERPLIYWVVDSLCYPAPEDQVIKPGGGRFFKAWAEQFVETFTGASPNDIKKLSERAIKHFSGAIVLRAATSD